MKKGYVVITIVLIFLLFLPFAFGGSDEVWRLCDKNNDETTENFHKITISPTSYYCCDIAGTFKWQTSECETCDDEIENQDEAGVDCGGICVTSTTEICNGIDDNKDCSIDNGLTPELCTNQLGVCEDSEKTCEGTLGWKPDTCGAIEYGPDYQLPETICDGLDNDCDGTIDEGCDDDKDSYADSSMTCTGSFLDGNGVTQSCVTNSGDCKDSGSVDGVSASNINPGETEIADNPVDENCDGRGLFSRTCTVGNNIACNLDANAGDVGDIYEDVAGVETCLTDDGTCTDGDCGGSTCEPPCSRQKTSGGDCSDTCVRGSSTVKDYELCSAGDISCPSTTFYDECSFSTLEKHSCFGNDVDTQTSSEDCNSKDGWKYCSGSTRKNRDYSCSERAPPNGDHCDFNLIGSENCATKASVDSDGSPTAYKVPGTVTDYIGCSGGSCTFTLPLPTDSCSGTVLTEYGASGVGVVVSDPPKECQDFETDYCSTNRRFRAQWGCSGAPGFCNDAAVPDTRSGTDSDSDGVDAQCGDSLCDNNANFVDSNRQCDAGQTQCSNGKFQTCNNCGWQNSGTDSDGDGVDQQCEDNTCDNAPDVCDTAVSGKCSAKTSTETTCNDGLDNDCNGKIDCEDPACASQTGPGNVICCQDVSNCNALNDGNCGERTCNSNVCDAVEDKTKCLATTGTCGFFLDTCTSQDDGSFSCDYAGNNDLCGCEETCGAGFNCAAITCDQPNILDYCDESILPTPATCAPDSYDILLPDDTPTGIFTQGPQPCTEQFPGLGACSCHSCFIGCPGIPSIGGSTTIGSAICS